MTVTLTRLLGATCAAALCLAASGKCNAGTLTTLTELRSGAIGAGPSGGLVRIGHTLFGAAISGGDGIKRGLGPGTVFSVNLVSGKAKEVAVFPGTSISFAYGGLTNVGGILYGTTSENGSSNEGMLYSVDPVTNAFSVVSSYGDNDRYPTSAVITANGKFYTTTAGNGQAPNPYGTICATDPTTGVTTVAYAFKGARDGNHQDGGEPFAGLTKVGERLYGTTQSGGNFGNGTIFSFDPTMGIETVRYRFPANGSQGFVPTAKLLKVGDFLYGTTTGGGSSASGGTVFKLDYKTRALTVLHTFTGKPDGSTPRDAVIDVSGKIYGTTESGGASNQGTIYVVDPTTGAESVVYSFTGGEGGAYPFGPLLEFKGALYGTTGEGGRGCGGYGCGTVFKFQP